jgi:arylsulfatase A-like enzyme
MLTRKSTRVACTLLLLEFAGTPAGISGTQPNILLILADDVGAEASGLYPELVGSSGAVPTPTIENLAAKGLVFDNAWASPMCSPTRATILSGLYGNRTGVTNAGDTLPTSTTSLFEYIAGKSPAKYNMGVFGKWHLGGNIGNIRHVQNTGVPAFRGFLGAQISDYFNWTAIALKGAPANTTTYATTAITDYATDFIQRHKATRPSDPWFVYVPYNAAHSPNQVPPSNLHSVNVGGLEPGDTSNTVAVYKAMIQAMDTEIGRLLRHVDLKTTIVIFMGDNGTPLNVKDMGSGVKDAKQSVYEGGVRVPLVFAGADVTRKGREDQLVVSSDLYATVAALTGIRVSQIHDSFSLVPLLTAHRKSGRTHAFTELCSGGTSRYAIRDAQHKLLYNNGSWGLYDLINDPLESTNHYNNGAYAAIRGSLEMALDEVEAAAVDGCFE